MDKIIWIPISRSSKPWKHKKYPSRIYFSSYRFTTGEREFILTARLKNGKFHNISFESWEAARGLGWKKFDTLTKAIGG